MILQLQTIADGSRYKERSWTNLEQKEQAKWGQNSGPDHSTKRKTQRELWEERQAKLSARSTSNT